MEGESLWSWRLEAAVHLLLGCLSVVGRGTFVAVVVDKSGFRIDRNLMVAN